MIWSPKGASWALLALLTFAPPALAQTESFGQTVMAPGKVSDLGAPLRLRYQHERRLPPAPESGQGTSNRMRPLQPVSDGALVLEWPSSDPAGGQEIALWARQEGSARLIAPFSARSPNPVLLYFLENVLRAMANATGGNPDYIRNRLRLQIGELTPHPTEGGEREIRFSPFKDDPQAARMGPFAALEITIRWSDARPGALTLLSARLEGDAVPYEETLRLMSQE